MFPSPEPSLHYHSSIFDVWFGIPFQDSLHTTPIRVPHPLEIITLYNLSFLIILYISLLSSKYIEYLVLHTFPFCLSKHTSSICLSNILSSPIFPPIFRQSISSCSTLQPLIARGQWFTTYKNDHETNFLMEYLHQNSPMNTLCITKLDTTYHKAIAQNSLCIISYRLLYLEPIAISTNYIFHIILPPFLRRIIFNSMYASPVSVHIGE